ncbi:MAG: type IIL restriction-modification enzyme MmeI [Planctomycetaceae bacterium]
MNTTETATPISGFIDDCKRMSANERANCQPFLIRLCDVLGLTSPEGAVADVAKNAYVFERDVTFHNPNGTTSTGRIDLYKRGCFVLEAKQGSEQLTDLEREDAGLVGAKKKKKGTAVRGTKGWLILR